MANHKLSIDAYLKKIFSVFQELMMSQKSDRAIFALVGFYAAYIDSTECFRTTFQSNPGTHKLSQNFGSQLPVCST